MWKALLANTDRSFWMPEKASTVSGDVDGLFGFIYWLCVFFFALITLLLVFFVVKYRHRKGQKHDPGAGHSTTLELTWTIIPTILVLVIFYYGFRGYLNMSVEPPNAYQIDVTGSTWSWRFDYPGGIVSDDGKLHIPVNTPIRIILGSQDVIHSMFIPDFRVKKDAVPGRYNRFWFEATKTGEYDLFCAEYCGDQHSTMITKVIVYEKDKFREKLGEMADWRGRKSPVDAGLALYTSRGCNACHTLDGKSEKAPTWKDFYGSMVPLADGTQVLADENYIAESIRAPQAKVHQGFGPPSAMSPYNFSTDDMLAITSFMKSISKHVKESDLAPLKKVGPKPIKGGAPATAPAAGVTPAATLPASKPSVIPVTPSIPTTKPAVVPVTPTIPATRAVIPATKPSIPVTTTRPATRPATVTPTTPATKPATRPATRPN